MRKVVSFKSKRDAVEFPTNVSAKKTRSSPKCACVLVLVLVFVRSCSFAFVRSFARSFVRSLVRSFVCV